MNLTPFSERFYIGIFGACNAGKSSLINAISNQNISIVSNFKGTTTDPVFKAMEFPKIGACVLVDTPGFDEQKNYLSKIRVKKSLEVLEYVQAAILILVNNKKKLSNFEKEMLEKIQIKKIPLIIVINEFFEQNDNSKNLKEFTTININAKTKKNIDKLIDLISVHFFKKENENQYLIADLLKPKENVVLVIKIDKSYPKGRLILPQQQLLNELLKKGVVCHVCTESEYSNCLENLKEKPKLVVTDSQIFPIVFNQTPKNLNITSFSILLARKRNILKTAIESVKYINEIKKNDKILICESCTHKKNNCDIGSVLIPKLIEKHIKTKPSFHFLTGVDFEENIDEYKLIIHCGACMTSTKKLQNRFSFCKKHKIPITNYGVLLAYLNNILDKTTFFLN